MKAHIKIGSVLGIEIGLHLSWFIIALLITLSLAQEFHAVNPRWGEGVVWSTAIFTGLLFFVTIITPFEVIEIDRARWPYTTVKQAMRPLDRLPGVTPETPITKAIEIMESEKVNELPVARNGRIEGLVTRGGVMRLLQTRAALEM